MWEDRTSAMTCRPFEFVAVRRIAFPNKRTSNRSRNSLWRSEKLSVCNQEGATAFGITYRIYYCHLVVAIHDYHMCYSSSGSAFAFPALLGGFAWITVAGGSRLGLFVARREPSVEFASLASRERLRCTGMPNRSYQTSVSGTQNR